MTKAIMIQGAGSNVGKSMIVAGLARAYSRQGLRVAPFKPQNMSNNASVTIDGGEIGRAQALQALAARRDPTVDMNPVLLKPESDTGAQIVVQGQHFATLKARDYGKQKRLLLPKVLDSFSKLAGTADLILVEGAGSPAEINLRAGDIANMGFAEAAGVPVVLVGDIDRGGVIAQIVGTHAVLAPADQKRIVAFAVNKFRGDPSLFDEGLIEISKRTDWPSVGVLSWFPEAWKLPAEDVMDISGKPGGSVKVAVPRLDRIANFDDLDPLSATPEISVEIIEPGRALPGDATLVLIPGSKSTISDLAAFRENGWDIDLDAHIRRGGHVLGICGGYQMLGREIHDPHGIEGSSGSVPGLGHLDVTTIMKPDKNIRYTKATYLPSGEQVSGYEIHIGDTKGPSCKHAWLSVEGRREGASSADGRVRGCYLHGLFSSDDFRNSFMAGLGADTSRFSHAASIEATLEKLADHVQTYMDLDHILKLAREVN